MRSKHYTAAIIDDKSKHDPAFCPCCQKFDKLSPLEGRIYLDENGKRLPPPPDYDNWLM